MNKGTVIRTIMAIALVINDGAIASGIAEFEDPTVSKWYKIASFVATAVVLFVNTYYNNDYTEEARLGTNLTRQLKTENKAFTEEMESMADLKAMEVENDGENERQ